MNVIEFLGGFYIDARRVEFACLMPLLGIVRTHLGDLQPLAHQLPLFTRIATVPEFQIAGAANEANGTVHYHDGDWFLDPRISHGENGCIFDCDGILRIIEPAPDQTSQGYRYVAPDCRLVLGDETILLHGVSKYTDLSSAQDGSFLIGQGHDVAGIVVFIDGALRMIQAGACYEPRAVLDGDIVTVAFYDVAPDGLEAFIIHATVAELRALPAIGETPAPQPPKIGVQAYGSVIAPGKSWNVVFKDEGSQTEYLVGWNEQARLTIRGENASGSDTTGLVRQLVIQCPQSEPEPEPVMLKRFGYQPNIGSQDLLDVFATTLLNDVGFFVLYAQHISTDATTPQLGPNYWPNFLAKDFVRRLKQTGIPLTIEAGSVKPFDCDAYDNIANMQKIVQRVADAGGEIAAFAMDEPLTANQMPVLEGGCHLPLSDMADAVAAYIHSVKALDPGIQIIWLEAWPEVSIGDQQAFLGLLEARNAIPEYWRSDIDWNRAKQEHKDPAAFIRECQVIANNHGVTYGLFVNSTADPIATDQAHHDNLIALANKIRGIHPTVAQICVASWAHRVAPDPTHASQNVPNNLGPVGMLQTYTNVEQLFIAQPEPEPTPEVDPMLYKFMGDSVIRVKQLKPIDGQAGKFTAILPNDRVVSIQPDGSFETRDSGTAAAYEECYQGDGLLFYEPQPEHRYSYAYRLLPV